MERLTPEHQRLAEANEQAVPWYRWGPYLSERQWGTVREDYSAGGAAWDYFPHDHARSRAYRWGEDGLLGICDDRQRLCFALALWNEADPILKERLFGLTNSEGNHGEDVKEYYFYLDATPTNSYLRALYKYPHAAFPYSELVEVNRQRKSDTRSAEYELLDTGIFDGSRYTDVQVEYAKESPTDILVRISLSNRGPEAKVLHLLPTLWFRNIWSWEPGLAKPVLRKGPATANAIVVEANHPLTERMWLACEGTPELLFVENETNSRRVFGSANSPPYPKDGINDYLVSGNQATVNPQQTGTKAAAHYRLRLEPGQTQVVRLRLTGPEAAPTPFGSGFEATFQKRLDEADAFYRAVAPPELSDDRRSIQRQAFAGLLWSKEFFYFAVQNWLDGDPGQPPPPPERRRGRNRRWTHFYAEDVLLMPDAWEYPWFAAWDHCFQCVVLALIDPAEAKRQLYLLAREWYMSPEGQIPAYEWSFDDVNPPLHAWAAWRIYNIEKKMTGTGDHLFVEQVFHRCLLYFTWWVNRKDADGNNLFQGGFLGMDNIGVFDRNTLPPGTRLYQSDGTSLMGMFALDMGRLAFVLARDKPHYLDLAAKFFRHFLYIADAMNHLDTLSEGEANLWDEEDGFFYDVLRLPDGTFVPMKVRSMVGLLALFPVGKIDLQLLRSESFSVFRDRILWFAQHEPGLMAQATSQSGATNTILLSFVKEDQLRRILARVLNEQEFLGPHGIRSLSKAHARQPYYVEIEGQWFGADYEPAESTTATFGGNSNWRGPVWFPVNFLLLESLERFYAHFGDSFTVECPTGSGVHMNLRQVGEEITRRLISTFERDADGKRPVDARSEVFQHDPHWRDLVLFFEYFHGDNGAGLGASHQTGWTALVANLIERPIVWTPLLLL